MKHSKATGSPLVIPIIIVVILLIAAGGIMSVTSSLHEETHTGCRVTDKDIRGLNTNQDTQPPRVYTSCGTFEISDVPLAGHFSAGDVYGQLEEGETYSLVSRGWRVPFLSIFPSIIKVS